jgi:uncharacterized membrane protein
MGPPPTRLPPHRNPHAYWPLALPFLVFLAAPLLALVLLVAAGALDVAFASMGLTPVEALGVLAASLLGASLNLPLLRLRGRPVHDVEVVRVFGVRYLVPTVVVPETVVGLNVGGAVVPTGLSAYLWWRTGLGLDGLIGVGVTGLVVHLLARPVRGLGIAVPALGPAALAAAVALVLHPAGLGALAYVSGTLGTLVGADLTNLHRTRDLGAPVVSIGGAGTFDGIFTTGLLAVLLAALVR